MLIYLKWYMISCTIHVLVRWLVAQHIRFTSQEAAAGLVGLWFLFSIRYAIFMICHMDE